MKKLFQFMLVAVAALAISSCSAVKENDVFEDKHNVSINVIAKADNLASDDIETKTYITTYNNVENTILWGTDEYMLLAITADGYTSVAQSSSSTAGSFSGQPEATFRFDIEHTASGDSYLFQGLYPMSAYYYDNKDAANLPNRQQATASSYDPAAYIMVAKPESFTSIKTEWQASFRRATALNKITLNIPSGIPIDKVVITAPSGKYLAGLRNIDLSTGESGDVYSGTETIEVDYVTPLNGSNVDVWFTSWGVEIEGGETLTIVAYPRGSSNGYTKTIKVPSGKSIKFKEGCLNTLKANMSRYEKVTSNLADWSGEYLIVCEAHSLAFDSSLANFDWYGNGEEVQISNGSIVSNSETDKWMFTIEKMEGGYSLKGTNGMFVDVPLILSAGICSASEPHLNTISFENGNVVFTTEFVVNSQHGQSHQTGTLRYEDDESKPDYFCYRTYHGGQPIQLYKKTMISNN